MNFAISTNDAPSDTTAFPSLTTQKQFLVRSRSTFNAGFSCPLNFLGYDTSRMTSRAAHKKLSLLDLLFRFIGLPSVSFSTSERAFPGEEACLFIRAHCIGASNRSSFFFSFLQHTIPLRCLDAARVAFWDAYLLFDVYLFLLQHLSRASSSTRGKANERRRLIVVGAKLVGARWEMEWVYPVGVNG